MADTNSFLKMYDDDRTQQINNMYDAQKASTMAGLESAYNQNISNAQAAREQINPTYQQSANDVSAAYERTRRNNNQIAAANGLNTGAAGQQAVAQSNAYMNALGQVRTAQANALNAADRGMADMEAQYKMQVAQALANNDYQRAAALFDESQNQYARSQDRAKILAGYGDFSGYAGLYGEDAANQMSTIWNTQNPDLAYQLGRISGDQYYNITGKYPIGYTPVRAASSGGSSGEMYWNGKPVSWEEYKTLAGLNGETSTDGANGYSGPQSLDDLKIADFNTQKAVADGIMRTAQISAQNAGLSPSDPYYSEAVANIANQMGYQEAAAKRDDARANSYATTQAATVSNTVQQAQEQAKADEEKKNSWINKQLSMLNGYYS